MLYTVYLDAEVDGVTVPTMVAVFLLRSDAEDYVSNLPFNQDYKDRHRVEITNSKAWDGWAKIRACTCT